MASVGATTASSRGNVYIGGGEMTMGPGGVASKVNSAVERNTRVLTGIFQVLLSPSDAVHGNCPG